MNRIVFLSAILLLIGVSAFGQNQDSLIVGSATVDSGQTFVFIPVYAVTFDSVSCYCIPFECRDPNNAVCFGRGIQYFPPLTTWDEYLDTVYDCHHLLLLGWEDFGGPINLPIFTHGERQDIFTFRFLIDPNAAPELAIIDTFYDNRYGSLGFCAGDTQLFTPAFQPGFISIRGVGIDNRPIPNSIDLSPNYPNPFNSSTVIDFSLANSDKVSLVVYDITGRTIKTLTDKTLSAGLYSISWNGKGDDGVDVASEIYFYRLTVTGKSQTRTMTLLR
jgi:hypothetical protein